MSRDRLAAYFWPESDAEHARHALAQLLYVVRRGLSGEAILGAGDEIRLDPEVIASDVGEFERALAAGDRERAVALYEGPFLDGFHLGDAPEFERWVDGERSRLEAQVAAALERLGRDAAARGDHAGSVQWWRRLAALDPLNSCVAVDLMGALGAAGNRPGALQHAYIYETLVRDQLGIAPDAAVLALAERLREAATQIVVSPGRVRQEDAFGESPPADPPPLVVPEQTADAAEPPLPETPLPAKSGDGARWTLPRWLTPWPVPLVIAGVLGFLLVSTLNLIPRAESGSASGSALVEESNPELRGSAIAVLPFSVYGGTEFAYLREGMVDLLSTNLDGAGELRTVDPRALLSFVSADSAWAPSPEQGREVAARFGARRYVLGAVVAEGGRLRIAASLYDRRRGATPVARAAVEGEAAELFRLVDELAAELLVEQYTGPRERLIRTAAATTQSLPALKAYLEGEADFREARYDAAVEAFEHAVDEDTSFALAYYRLSIADDWTGRLDRAVEVSEGAMRHRDRLPEHDRQLVEAYHAWRHGAADEAERLYRTIVDNHPDDVEAWYQLGEVLFHYNPNRGHSFTESRQPFERVLSFEPDHRGALVHLVRAAAYEGNRAELDALLARVLTLTPEPERLELRAFRAFALGSRADQDRIVEELRAATQDVLWHSAWRIAVYGRDLAGAERIARLLVDPARPPQTRVFGHTVLAPLLLGQGRWRAARAEGLQAERLSHDPTKGTRAYFAALRIVPIDRAQITELRDGIANSDRSAIEPNDRSTVGHFNVYGGLLPQIRVYQWGLLNARLGETAEAETRARELDAMGMTPEAQALARYFAAMIRADVARSRNRPHDAHALLDQASATDLPMDLQDAFGAQGHAAWTRAEVLRELGRDEEALAWYASLAQIAVDDVMYRAPAHLRQGEIHERLGNRKEAVEHYAHFVELWKNADPELRPMLAGAQRRLARLRK